MNEDLKIIKKYYGEKMMHLCRQLFPTLLEQEGLLSRILLDIFAPTKFLYDDIVEMDGIKSFQDFIFYVANLDEDNKFKTNKTPKQLLKEIGYELYECKSENDIQKFKRYYAHGEELCTFDGGRLNYCHVFFAVKQNAEKLKRSKFKNPERQDEYGTSVISIQFTKGKINTLSIKNRYNHTVSNPDATFSNNLENIIEGLTDSFQKEYNLNINQNISKNFCLSNYVKANDKKYYKYNHEINNIYYCPNNIIIDRSEVKQLPKEKYIVLDYFIIDLVNKKIETYDKKIKDSFLDDLKDIEKIDVYKTKNTTNKRIEILSKDGKLAIIEIDEKNRIIGYKNENIINIKDNFLYKNKSLKRLEASKLETCGNYFLIKNIDLEYIYIPKLKEVGNNFLSYNKELKSLYAFELKKVGNYFLENNTDLYDIIVPKLKEVGNSFLISNYALLKFRAPKLEKVGNNFISSNEFLKSIFLPSLIKIGDDFLYFNHKLRNIDLPSVEKIGDNFMLSNSLLNEINIPNAKKIGNDFLRNNIGLRKISIPNVIEIGMYFLYKNKIIEEIYMPMVKTILGGFLYSNKSIKILQFNELQRIGIEFLLNNKNVCSKI